MMQDGLQIAGTLGGKGRGVPLMQTLIDGRGFVKHVEDGYYEAMLEILRVSELSRPSLRRSIAY